MSDVEVLPSEEDSLNPYESSIFLLPYVLRECDREDARVRDLTSRIPILITIATFFAGYVFKENIVTEYMFKENYKLGIVCSSMYLLCILGIGISIGIFIWIICSRKYKRMDIDLFINDVAQSSKNDVAAFELTKGYIDVYKFNFKVNDKKTILYNVAVAALVIAVMIYILVQIILFFYK
ncbi:MAG: hypothetical protein ACRCXT_10565 [Paraclostridium sp.]